MAAISSGSISVPESGPSWLAPPDRVLKKELAGLDDQALLGIARLRTHALGYLRSRLLDLKGTRANAGRALASQPPTGRASATSANRL
jgi:hypothetical protein